MSLVNTKEVREFVLEYLKNKDTSLKLESLQIDDSFDFLEIGIIDSMGLLEMISSLEEQFGITVDFEEMDTDEFTILGSFSQYVSTNAKNEI